MAVQTNVHRKYYQVEVEYDDMTTNVTRHFSKLDAYSFATKLQMQNNVVITRLVVMKIDEHVKIE